MAKQITQEEIFEMNKLYLELGTYSGVAKATGRAASTVKKYIIPDFDPEAEQKKNTFTLADLADMTIERVKHLENICEVCKMSDEEWKEITELRKEILM